MPDGMCECERPWPAWIGPNTQRICRICNRPCPIDKDNSDVVPSSQDDNPERR